MDTAFLTGATGFLGANLARLLLERGMRVRALSRRGSDRRNLEGLPVDVVEGDLSDSAALDSGCRGARWAFHLAADYRLWSGNPRSLYACNVEGTRNVLAAAGRAGVERIVHCSSVAAVKVPDDPDRPSDETRLYRDVSEIIGDYKRSKWLAENVALKAARDGLPVVVVNPSAPIGAHDARPTPTGRIVVDFLNGRLPSYIDTGFNVIHARDAAQGHVLAAVKGRVGERYILGCRNITFKHALDTLAELTGLPGPRFKTPYALAYAFAVLDTSRARLFGGEPLAPLDAVRMARHKMYFDASKAVRELGLPQTPAREALRDAVEWFLDHRYVTHPARAAAARAALPASGQPARGRDAAVV